MEGRCQCGHIRFITPLPRPLKIYFCHCTECRHQSSSAHGVSAIFPSFEIPNPVPGSDITEQVGLYIRHTLRGCELQCLFCRRCGARLVHRVEGDEKLSVKGGCLVDLNEDMMRHAEHIWCKEAVVEIPDRLADGTVVVKHDEEPV
ncbi:hypothetical protein ASPZODRAFT_126611 [Penicilliopsis zonata CBS 506.65]|uniref:CENP-V/GFA domain-containing protein n=1 Tax=Penicilliopsis zonata CBS 506.65 TaxID=1073090 RepID=A0A1L9SU71_9EURO|nr:hypothetical protein ASPZODRAFT_126611 [Penicilliopsis zonata CBS 506.65]OJJ50686.1 hypothetical protein ASPZODRAFT_126611 [Penicilliopsis zonata CBS 506.65]